MELTRAHSRNERTTNSPLSIDELRKPTPESIFGDLIDPDKNAAISLAKYRIEWKKKRLLKRC